MVRWPTRLADCLLCGSRGEGSVHKLRGYVVGTVGKGSKGYECLLVCGEGRDMPIGASIFYPFNTIKII